MTSLYDLAVLSQDVYASTILESGGAAAADVGWTRSDRQLWGKGFAAGTYRKGDETVIAYRGTDDSSDVVSDARMAPLLKTASVNETLETLLTQYRVDTSRTSIRAIKLWLLSYLEDPRVQIGLRVATSTLGNQVPPGQTKKALDYFDASFPKPTYVCGHSLGGALAKAVSDERSIAAVGFNSPYMGDMRGTIPMTSTQILSVNAVGDPLSLATRTLGNLPHGAQIDIELPPISARPPVPPQVVRRNQCGWRDFAYGGVGGYRVTVKCRV